MLLLVLVDLNVDEGVLKLIVSDLFVRQLLLVISEPLVGAPCVLIRRVKPLLEASVLRCKFLHLRLVVIFRPVAVFNDTCVLSLH